jgi:hypothetical protein
MIAQHHALVDTRQSQQRFLHLGQVDSHATNFDLRIGATLVDDNSLLERSKITGAIKAGKRRINCQGVFDESFGIASIYITSDQVETGTVEFTDFIVPHRVEVCVQQIDDSVVHRNADWHAFFKVVQLFSTFADKVTNVAHDFGGSVEVAEDMNT